MELTRLEKALVLSCLVGGMEKTGVEVNLKPSEATKIIGVVMEEVECLSEKEQEKAVIQAHQNALHKLYDSLVGKDDV